MQAKPEQEIKQVRPKMETITKQRLPYFVGVSNDSVGSKGISMNLVVIPPGGSAEPHYHKGFETAIYMLEGEVETRYGDGLKKAIVNKKGDFLFIPPGLPHQPVNLSATKPAMAIVSRNDPNERENVVLYEV